MTTTPTADTPTAMPRPGTLRTSALMLAGALAVLGGCATNTGGGSAGTDGGHAPAGSAPASGGAQPAKASAPAGMGYDELATSAKGPIARARQELVGQTVAIDLQAIRNRRGAPTGAYQVQAGDNLNFRCLSAERGFSGGPVVSEVRAVRTAPKSAVRTIDLARCDGGAGAAPAPVSAPTPAPAPRAERTAPASAGAGTVGAGKPGLDARGNVVDSSKVESGSGRTVKGINDYEGEITGNPAANSRFTRLQIGMPAKQVTDLIGQPTDQGAYLTGKAWIPFYFGGDRHRFELVYKGQGRLIFAGGGVGDFSSGNLIWIIHNASEGGYR